VRLENRCLVEPRTGIFDTPRGEVPPPPAVLNGETRGVPLLGFFGDRFPRDRSVVADTGS